MAAAVETAAVALRCQAQLLGCVDAVAYRHADPGMAGDVLYCYACLPQELRLRATQLVYREDEAPPPRTLDEAVAELMPELPPAVVAGTVGRRISRERMPRMKPATPLAPAPRIHHSLRPTEDPELPVVRPDPRVPEPVRPVPPAPEPPTPPAPPAPPAPPVKAARAPRKTGKKTARKRA